MMCNAVSSKKDIKDMASCINTKLAYAGYQLINIRSGYGKYGVSGEDNSDISMLMTIREMIMYLNGFEDALDYVMKGKDKNA